MTAYYNEIDPFAAAWLRELIKAGLIAPGDVDERSIEDVTPMDLRGYTQCHFFAGIGGWSYALRLAGWPDDRPAWTGSCPCQPFSSAGKGAGFADERHLWPAWFWLIRQCQPVIVFGEQVASKAGLGWFDVVSADLEAEGYAVGAVDCCAASVGTPHIRQRLWFVADSRCREQSECSHPLEVPDGRDGATRPTDSSCGSSSTGILADAECGTAKRHGHDLGTEAGRVQGQTRQWERVWDDRRDGGPTGSMADANGPIPGNGGLQRGGGFVQPTGDAVAIGMAYPSDGNGGSRERRAQTGIMPNSIGRRRLAGRGSFSLADAQRDGGRADEPGREQDRRTADGGIGPTNGHWAGAEWLPCRDGKARPVEPGSLPLAHGIPGRVGRLRGYGNSIVPQVAAEFVRAYLDTVNL